MRPIAIALALAVPATACTFQDGGLPAGQVLRDDSAADFAASGSTLTNAEISDTGLISPIAYATGALLAKGANSELFTDATTADWATLDAATPARIALAAPLGDFASGAPVGVGITSGDHFTMWMAGEIWLEAGVHQFDLAADDRGFLELAPAGGPFQRITTAIWSSPDGTGSFTAPADGWYGIHLAMSEAIGSANFKLQHQPPGGGMLALDPDRLRVAVGGQRGLIADAFDDFYLVRPVGRSLTAAGMLDQDFGSGIPADTGITAPASYSFHWAAQARIDVAGDYAFTVDTDDGHRLRVDGALVADHLVNISQTSTSAPLHLDPGWHDMVIDYTQFGAAAHAKLRVASGPDLAGGPFPLERTRPVVPRTDRVAGASDDSDLTYQPSGIIAYTLTPPIPAGATIDGIDATYTISAAHLRDVAVTAIAPDGSRGVIRAQNDVDHTGTSVERRSTHDLDGKGASGVWHLEFADKAGLAGGSTRDGAITIHYVGGRPPIATTASYDSAVHDLGAPSHLDEIKYQAAAPTGTAVVVRVRTGASADELMAQPWSDPVVSGDPPIVAAGQFVQYRVELSSDGDRSATFDWVQIVYRAVP